jgi:hypothetical protein
MTSHCRRHRRQIRDQGDITLFVKDLLRALAASFGDALSVAGFDFERPSLEAALGGYERWLGVPVPGTRWGESDCGIAIMEPELGVGYRIDLLRYVGEPDGGERSVGLVLGFVPERSPTLCREWGTTTEAYDDPPSECVGALRRDRAIAAALAEDRPVSAELQLDGIPIS